MAQHFVSELFYSLAKERLLKALNVFDDLLRFYQTRSKSEIRWCNPLWLTLLANYSQFSHKIPEKSNGFLNIQFFGLIVVPYC